MSRCMVVVVTGPPPPRTPAPQLPAPPPSPAEPLDDPLDPLGLPEPPLSDALPLPAEPLPGDAPLPPIDPLVLDPLLPAAVPLPTDVAPLDGDPLDGGLPEDGEPDPVVELASESTATWPPSDPEQPQKARPAAIEPAQTAARHARTARTRPSFTFAGGSRQQCMETQVCRRRGQSIVGDAKKERRDRSVRWCRKFTARTAFAKSAIVGPHPHPEGLPLHRVESAQSPARVEERVRS